MIVVVVTTTVLGRADQLTTACVVGTVLVVGGCFLVPMTRFSDLRWSNYMCPSCGSEVEVGGQCPGCAPAPKERVRHKKRRRASAANCRFCSVSRGRQFQRRTRSWTRQTFCSSLPEARRSVRPEIHVKAFTMAELGAAKEWVAA